MTGQERNPDQGAGADKPFQFTDRRRIDPTTGTLRDPAAGAPAAGPGGPFVSPSNPGDPNAAAQPLTVEDSSALHAAQQQVAERTADLQRVSAEYANYRKRVDRDREQVVTQAKSSVVTDLLGVLDDIDRANAHGDLTGAFKAVSDKLDAALGKQGLERVGAQGDPFDPAHHEAVQFATSADVTEPTVTEVLRVGYAVGGRLVRPAVVVVTGPEHGGGGEDPQPAPVVDPDPQHSGDVDPQGTPEPQPA